MDDGITKRDMLHMGSMSAAMLFLARPVEAQQAQVQAAIELTLEQAISLHTSHIAERRQATPDRQPLSGESLSRLVGQLVEVGGCSPAQGEFLIRLIESAFSSESRAQLQAAVDGAIESSRQLLTEATEFIVEIYRSSIRVAADLLTDIDWSEVRTAIMADFGGAVDGARLGVRFGPQGATIGAVFGATVMSGFFYASAGAA